MANISVRTCEAKDRGRCSNAKMEVTGHRKMKTKTEMESPSGGYKKRHEGERSKDRRKTIPENMEIAN